MEWRVTMQVSIFEALGPIMIGPSSSHTAGAARLSRIAAQIAGRSFSRVSFGLHGSFAKTYRGHGTDKALVAGALGLYEDDERLSQSFHLAKERGLRYDFYEIALEGVHENTVKITFYHDDGISEIIGSSIGGAQILIREIDGFALDYSAHSAALLLTQRDKKGVISKVTGILADRDINIGVMKVSRRSKGDTAHCILEVDTPIPGDVLAAIRECGDVMQARAIDPA